MSSTWVTLDIPHDDGAIERSADNDVCVGRMPSDLQADKVISVKTCHSLTVMATLLW